MSVKTQRRQSNYYLERPPSRGLPEALELILDKGLIIDAYARVSLFGTELITVDARMVIASIDTYLRFAEATCRLDLDPNGGPDRTELSESATRDGGEERGATKVAHTGNGAHHDKDIPPQLGRYTLDSVKPARNSHRHAGRKPRDLALATRPPGTGCVRPYDWKASTAGGLLR